MGLLNQLITGGASPFLPLVFRCCVLCDLGQAFEGLVADDDHADHQDAWVAVKTILNNISIMYIYIYIFHVYICIYIIV